GVDRTTLHVRLRAASVRRPSRLRLRDVGPGFTGVRDLPRWARATSARADGRVVPPGEPGPPAGAHDGQRTAQHDEHATDDGDPGPRGLLRDGKRVAAAT